MTVINVYGLLIIKKGIGSQGRAQRLFFLPKYVQDLAYEVIIYTKYTF